MEKSISSLLFGIYFNDLLEWWNTSWVVAVCTPHNRRWLWWWPPAVADELRQYVGLPAVQVGLLSYSRNQWNAEMHNPTCQLKPCHNQAIATYGSTIQVYCRNNYSMNSYTAVPFYCSAVHNVGKYEMGQKCVGVDNFSTRLNFLWSALVSEKWRRKTALQVSKAMFCASASPVTSNTRKNTTWKLSGSFNSDCDLNSLNRSESRVGNSPNFEPRFNK